MPRTGDPSAARFPTTCRSASPEALAGLCTAYWYRLSAFIRRRGNDPERALDLTQDDFARLLERGTQVMPPRSRAYNDAHCLITARWGGVVA